MSNKYIIVLGVFIFGIGIILGNITSYFFVFNNNFEIMEEVSDDETVKNVQYNVQEDTRIFHGGNYIENYGVIKYRDKILENIDIDSFTFLVGSYAKDKNNFYFAGKNIHISDGISEGGECFDVHTFEILQGGYAKDKTFFYYQDYGFLKHKNQKIKFISDKSENNYFDYFVKIGDELYYGSQKQIQIDSESFYHLKYNYFQDKNGIYFGNKLLALSTKYAEIIDHHFIKDDRFVFLDGEYYPGLDVKTFEKIQVPENHMYFFGLYSDKNGFYNFNAYSNKFYKIEKNISQENIEKCLQDQNLCKSVIGY